MSNKKRALIVCGGIGGVDVGFEAAGIETVGLELVDKIAAVARANGLDMRTANILDVRDWAAFGPIDIFHASPPCPNFSAAKAGAEETVLDMRLAAAICRAVWVLRARVVTLENVYGYRNSRSWGMIERCLCRWGYKVGYWHLNAADYGVPQTRRRMIVLGVQGRQPTKPEPTHARNPIFGLFPRKKWVGWYESVDDLVDGLPDTEFAPWQKEKLREAGFDESFILANGERSQPKVGALPCDTVTANRNQKSIRAFLVEGRSGGDRPILTRDGVEPMATMTTSSGGNVVRVFLPHTQRNSNTLSKFGVEPSTTLGAQKVSVRSRVVKLSVRALARLQSFPDWYKFPCTSTALEVQMLGQDLDISGGSTLALRGIGNSVPPKLAEVIGRHVVRYYLD